MEFSAVPPRALPVARPVAAMPADSPLTEVQYDMIRQAAIARIAVDRVTHRARVSAVSILFVAVVGLMLAIIWPGWAGILSSLAACGVAVVEWIGYQRFRRADPSAAQLLGFNQLCFMGVIIAYCVARMAAYSTGHGLSGSLERQLSGFSGSGGTLVGDIKDLAKSLYYAFYGLVIMLTIGFQGGMALYYFTRRKAVEQFKRQTPLWIQRLFLIMQT